MAVTRFQKVRMLPAPPAAKDCIGAKITLPARRTRTSTRPIRKVHQGLMRQKLDLCSQRSRRWCILSLQLMLPRIWATTRPSKVKIRSWPKVWVVQVNQMLNTSASASRTSLTEVANSIQHLEYVPLRRNCSEPTSNRAIKTHHWIQMKKVKHNRDSPL